MNRWNTVSIVCTNKRARIPTEADFGGGIKRYDDNGYLYAYHEEPQRKFLSQGKNGFLMLAKTDKDFAQAVPFDVLEKIWNDLHQTVVISGRIYKHLLTYEVDGKFLLRIRNTDTPPRFGFL